MRKSILFILMLSLSLFAIAQDKKAYQLFNGEGEKITYSDMLEGMKGTDLVFFGELHNNPIVHWIQLELTLDLYKEKGEDLIISAEMFEADNQVIVDEYLAGIISKSRFEEECRLWPNFKTDYKPLFDLAKDSSLTFVASNVPRRYANVVSKNGFEALDSLSQEAKSFLPPLPIDYDSTLNCYKSMLEMGEMSAHITSNFPKAQAIKDATMAYNINKYYRSGSQLIHYVGAFHTNNHEGIVWYMNRYSSAWKIKVISTVEQEDINELEDDNLGLGDYVLVVPENMTKTY